MSFEMSKDVMSRLGCLSHVILGLPLVFLTYHDTLHPLHLEADPYHIKTKYFLIKNNAYNMKCVISENL